METIRVLKNDDTWLSLECKVLGEGKIFVPYLKGTWLISKGGMVGNIGGNDWAIYTLNKEDCKRLCESM